MEVDTTLDIGYIEMYEEVLVEESISYVDGWDTPVQETANRILQEYLANTGKTEDILDEADVRVLDTLVFANIEGYEI